MSYAIGFAPDAQAAFDRLDIMVQEAVLDDLDRLAEAGDAISGDRLPLSFLHDLRVDLQEHAHYVFLTILCEPMQKTMTVEKLGYHVRRR